MSSETLNTALRIYEAVHGQELRTAQEKIAAGRTAEYELLNAEHRTRERVREELESRGLLEHFDRLFCDDQTEIERVRGVINRVIREEVAL